MSTFTFHPRSGPILVAGEITGPLRSIGLVLGLDTGATRSLINFEILQRIGVVPDPSSPGVSIITASGSLNAPQVVLTRFTALGQHRFGFPVVAHSLPPKSPVDGLLGLDFLRAFAITIDFPNGRITIA